MNYEILFMLILFILVPLLVVKIVIDNLKMKTVRYTELDNNKVLEYQKLINNNASLKNINIFRKILLILFIILVSIVFIELVIMQEDIPIFIYVIPIIIFAAYIIINSNYNKRFKSVIVSDVIKHYDANLEYNPSLGIPINDYEYADFEHFDKYYSEDLISRNILNSPYIISDVKTENIERDTDGDRTYTTIFNGVVSKVNLNKNINAFIYIINNNIRLFDNKYKVNIDNETFIQRYDTYSDNEVLAMRLLSPSVTTSILDMENKTGIKFEIKINNNIMFFRFYTNNLFLINQSSSKSAKNLVYSIEVIDDMKNIIASILEILQSMEV